MPSSAFLAPVADSRCVRRIADAVQRRAARRRVAALDVLNVEQVQTETLLRLVRTARDTKFGRDHDFAGIRSVADYQARVRPRDYEGFWNSYWKPSFPGLENATWPGRTPYYALSSGTTSGATKYIPVTPEMVKSNKKAAFTTLALFRDAYPADRLLTGKFLFLGGSTDLRPQADGSLAGDVSGIAARETPGVMRPYLFPPPEVALLGDWEQKLDRIAELGARERVTAVSGIPAWVYTLFNRVKAVTGKKTVADVWPDLRLVIHGGTAFGPYRDLFRDEIASDRVKFCEVYPSSEGFVAAEDPRHGLLRVVPDHGIFFEFIPVAELGKERPTRHTLATAETGVQYAVVLTTCAGLWSYLGGDTVCFERKDPPLIRFTGRTKYFLSAFGEHLISEEVEKAVAHAASACGANALDFHVGPVFPADPRKPGHHLYLVEFAGAAPDRATFAAAIDEVLCRDNEDYAVHRAGDLTMLRPEVRVVRRGGFGAWMAARGKAGGQNKVPRMDNAGATTRDLAAWLANGWFD